MKKPKKNKDHTTNFTTNDNFMQEPTVEYSASPTQQSYSYSMPGQYTEDEFMEYLDKAELRFEEGKGIPHDEALKMIHSWE